MRIEYERACIEAGMPEEKIMEIRRLFDADYKRLKREKQERKEAGVVYYSLEHLRNPDGESCYFEIPDPNMDVEQRVLHELELEQLREILNRLSPRDKQFILDCYAAEWGEEKDIAEKYGITIATAYQRKRRIVLKLRELFFGEEL